MSDQTQAPSGAYAGFDTYACPDLSLAAQLLRETNLRWMGYYLHAPSQKAQTWRGKRAALVAQGWGLAPIYVGQQVTGPGRHTVTYAQGKIDGMDAAARMTEEGFPSGAFVYLDLENGPPLSNDQRNYVAAWVDAVRLYGFGAGVYCSYLLAREIAALRPNLRIWVFHVTSVTPHPVAGRAFPAPHPSTSGFAGAVVWQREDEARLIDYDGLHVDLDVAAMPDPSAPLPSMLKPSTPIPVIPIGRTSPPPQASAPPTPAPSLAPPSAQGSPGFWQRVAAWFRSP